ncbi:MAG: response regulator [Actinomycetota bacterium]
MSAFPTPPAGTEPPHPAELPVATAPAVDRSRAIRVLLVDEQPMFTDALSRLLATERDLEPIGAVERIAEAVAACHRLSPDLALVDLRVRDMESVDGIRALRRASPTTSVIVVTDRDDPADISSAIRAGARAYVLKTRAVDELVAIIRQAMSGGMVLTVADVPSVIGRLQQARRSESEAKRTFARLTVREAQILEHLTNGRSTTETAAALHISPLTVRSHVRSILAKLGVHSKVEAVSYALRNGLVEVDRSA